MRTVAEVIDGLDRVAPFAKAAGWDPVGLQLGDPAAPAARVGVCHEVTPGVVAAAADLRLELLISYHPLLFRPTTRLVAGPSATGRAFRLVASGVALGVVHTAYDVAPGGVADALADILDLGDVAAFGPAWRDDAVKIVTFVPAADVDTVAAAMAYAGAGVIGNYTGCSFRVSGVGTFFAGEAARPVVGGAGTNAEPEVRLEMVAPAARRDRVVAALVGTHPYEEPAYDVYEVAANAGFIGRVGQLAQSMPLGEFAGLVSRRLGAAPRVAGDRVLPVRRVAVVPGSGSSMLGGVDADVVVTGDVGHHTARQALERGVAVVDPGHAPTERPGVQRLYAAVAQVVEDAIDLTAIEANPWEG